MACFYGDVRSDSFKASFRGYVSLDRYYIAIFLQIVNTIG